MAERRRPHVLIIMSDQQRADCAGYAGHPLLRTPAMDRIAGEGTNFTHAMTPAPLCMPARASFSTGTYPHNHSTWANRGLLRRDLPTLFNCFGDAGYDTALIGKAHLFAQSEINVRAFEPVMRGYGIAESVEVNGPRGTYQHDNNELTADWKRKGLYARYRADYEDRMRDARVVRASALPVDEHIDGWVGRRAVELIDGHAGTRPLFLFVGFPGPHEPWDAPGEYATMYAPEATPPALPRPATTALPEYARKLMDHLERGKRIEEMTAEHVRAIRANYYGKISLVDHWCGEILAAYRRRGLLDDLLVVFCSDHGEMLGDHGRLFKNTFHEAGLRVPLVFRWPDRIPAGKQSHSLIELTDVMPTLLDLVALPTPSSCLGRSARPVLEDPGRRHRSEVLSEVAWVGTRTTMVRTERHKYAVDGAGRPFMLYDLEQDPDEQTNLVGTPAGAELEGALRDLLLRRLLREQYALRNDHLPG